MNALGFVFDHIRMVLEYLKAIKKLQTWDDRSLLHQEPFLSTLERWKQGSSRNQTHANTLLSQLEQDLITGGLHDYLQHWLDLAFNCRLKESEQRVTVQRLTPRLFLQIQWKLANKENKVVNSIMQRQCKLYKIDWNPGTAAELQRQRREVGRQTKRKIRGEERKYSVKKKRMSLDTETQNLPRITQSHVATMPSRRASFDSSAMKLNSTIPAKAKRSSDLGLSTRESQPKKIDKSNLAKHKVLPIVAKGTTGIVPRVYEKLKPLLELKKKERKSLEAAKLNRKKANTKKKRNRRKEPCLETQVKNENHSSGQILCTNQPTQTPDITIAYSPSESTHIPNLMEPQFDNITLTPQFDCLQADILTPLSMLFLEEEEEDQAIVTAPSLFIEEVNSGTAIPDIVVVKPIVGPLPPTLEQEKQDEILTISVPKVEEETITLDGVTNPGTKYPSLITIESSGEILANWLNEGDDQDAEFPDPPEQFQYATCTDKPDRPPVEPLQNILPTGKPPLLNYPPIWAQARQEVCESFDWFRSYQGGVYFSRNVAKGYLLGGFSARRDIFAHGGKLIISHGGGKAQSPHRERGQIVTRQAADQLAQDKSVRALLATYKQRRPIALLIDDNYARFPYDLGAKDITYAVLGFYTIVHAWAEFQPADNESGRVVRYKFAFQWCEQQGEPWWSKSGGPNIKHEIRPSVTTTTTEINGNIEGENPTEELECVEQIPFGFKHIQQISKDCNACHQSSPRVYEKAWVCLNSQCPRFWMDENNQPLGDELGYNPRFLQLAPAESLAVPIDKLEPALPRVGLQRLTTAYAYTRGWHCRKCGRLSSRFKWEHWECMHCKEILKIEVKIRPIKDFLFIVVPVAFKESFIGSNSGIHYLGQKDFAIDGKGVRGYYTTYKLPDNRGFIHHIKARSPIGNNEANTIFRDYQEQAATGALPFRRWPMRAHKCRGALLTNYFSQNAGVPYQYVGGTENTIPFDMIPDAVVKARNLIQTRVKQALEQDVVFNEVLSAAYMERQRMAFHTDDEAGLGPFVAGLSLGSPALMHFRLLARNAPEGSTRSNVLSLILRHGDVLAMDGAGVQKFYEHTVVPTNFRIAATARYITSSHPTK